MKRLTERQKRNIPELLAKGMTKKEIAKRYKCSPWTIHNHASRVNTDTIKPVKGLQKKMKRIPKVNTPLFSPEFETKVINEVASRLVTQFTTTTK